MLGNRSAVVLTSTVWGSNASMRASSRADSGLVSEEPTTTRVTALPGWAEKRSTNADATDAWSTVPSSMTTARRSPRPSARIAAAVPRSRSWAHNRK